MAKFTEIKISGDHAKDLHAVWNKIVSLERELTGMEERLEGMREKHRKLTNAIDDLAARRLELCEQVDVLNQHKSELLGKVTLNIIL